MKQLRVVLPDNGEYQGHLELEGSDQVASCPVSGTNVPDGDFLYQGMQEIDEANPEALEAYGQCVLIFERPVDRMRVGIHGGATDVRGRLLPTHGNIRVSNEDLSELMSMISDDRGLSLQISHEKIRGLARITRPRVSRTTFAKPREIIRYSTPEPHHDDNTFFWLWLLESSSRHRVEDSGTFIAGGGSTGGGGASATFDPPSDPPSSAKVPEGSVNPDDEATLPVIVDPFKAESPTTQETATHNPEAFKVVIAPESMAPETKRVETPEVVTMPESEKFETRNDSPESSSDSASTASESSEPDRPESPGTSY